jgi:hypothetical protein
MALGLSFVNFQAILHFPNAAKNKFCDAALAKFVAFRAGRLVLRCDSSGMHWIDMW